MACSGTRQSNNITTANNPHGSTPLGVYTASDIHVGPGEVKHIDLIFAEQNFYGPQTYEQTLDGCLFMLAPGVNPPPCLHIVSRDDTYTNGHWVDPKGNQGSVLIPAEKGNMINQVLNIHWCPDQNYFLACEVWPSRPSSSAPGAQVPPHDVRPRVDALALHRLCICTEHSIRERGRSLSRAWREAPDMRTEGGPTVQRTQTNVGKLA